MPYRSSGPQSGPGIGATQAAVVQKAQQFVFGAATTPTQMYTELAPSIQHINQQYQRVAPKIDWAIDNFPLLLALKITAGLAMSIVGMTLYERYIRGE